MKSIILALLCLTSFKLQAQQIINGKVIDNQTLKGLEGVTITVRSGMVKTGKDGSFKLPIMSSDTALKIVMIGFETLNLQLTSNIVSPVLIRLKEKIDLLNEVIVSTGYQKIAKES